MIYLLFIFYCILFCWLITRIKFFKESGIPKRLLLSLFVLRILALIIGSYLNLYYFPFSDSLTLHNMGIEEYHLLLRNPHEYLTNIFHGYSTEQYLRLLDDTRSFWNNTRNYLIAKMLSIFDIFSGSNFLINTLFYNFLVFYGSVALYKVFIKIIPNAYYQLIIIIFALPSALFFTAMIHRDGLIFLSLSMIIFHLFFMMKNHHYPFKRIIVVCFFMLVIFLLRNFVFIVFIPALAGWLLANKFSQRAFLSFVIVYLIFGIFFFTSGLISPRTNLPRYVSERQSSFIKVGEAGASTININPLQPTFKSFVTNAPQAIDHALLHPYLTEINSFVYFPFAIEILLIEIFLFIFLFFRKKNMQLDPLLYLCIFFSLSTFFVIGYTVPIIGAIVRYRSIYLIFLLIPFVALTNWKKLSDNIRLKK